MAKITDPVYYRGEDGQLYSTWDEKRGADNRYRQQEEIKKAQQDNAKEQAEANRIAQAQLDFQRQQAAKEERMREKELEEQRERELQQALERNKQIEEERISKNKILKENINRELNNLSKEYTEIKKQYKEKIKMYDECLAIIKNTNLNKIKNRVDKARTEFETINKIKELIINVDFDFSDFLLGRSDLSLEEYRMLIKNRKNTISSDLNFKDILNKINYNKFLLAMLNSNFVNSEEYNKYINYDENENYEELYYKFLSKDKETQQKYEEQKNNVEKLENDIFKIKNIYEHLKNSKVINIENKIKNIKKEFEIDDYNDKIKSINKTNTLVGNVSLIVFLIAFAMILCNFELNSSEKFTIFLCLGVPIVVIFIIAKIATNKKILKLKEEHERISQKKQEVFDKKMNELNKELEKAISNENELPKEILKIIKSNYNNLFNNIIELGETYSKSRLDNDGYYCNNTIVINKMLDEYNLYKSNIENEILKLQNNLFIEKGTENIDINLIKEKLSEYKLSQLKDLEKLENTKQNINISKNKKKFTDFDIIFINNMRENGMSDEEIKEELKLDYLPEEEIKIKLD